MLLLNRRPSNTSMALIVIAIILGLLGYHGLFFPITPKFNISAPRSRGSVPANKGGAESPVPIPPEYGIVSESADGKHHRGACFDTDSAEYLRGLRSHAVEYCPSTSGASITCFHGTTTGQGRDSFCIARDVVLDEETGRFRLDCDIGSAGQMKPSGGIAFFDERQGQLETSDVFDKYFQIGRKTKGMLPSPLSIDDSQAEQSNYTILVKREDTANFWGSLMEILSMMLSVDILRMSSDSRLGDSIIAIPADLPRTQVIILDDFPEGPVYDLWSFFAGSAPIRFEDILEGQARADALLSAHTAIVALPGGSNPLAQIGGDDVSDCRNSAIAKTFARRVLQHYHVSYRGKHLFGSVKVVFVQTATHKVKDNIHLIKALRRAFPAPKVIAYAANFAALPMADQLTIVHSADVLIGAHGAELSHIMFMREGHGAVVEIQRAGLTQTRYRNLAALLGRKYFLAEAEAVPIDQAGSRKASVEQDHGGATPNAVEVELARRDAWDKVELVISEEDFVAQVGLAIEAVAGGS
ncbi:DUF563 domain-containing protein [Diaporthe amygdali]|uniref:DUF563 domain-containing protein n=1 Tax=Phomopsis amygdali TaxID=1214568 RepID=UPI0022FE1289|nr:DUF563 domain-containing protein [Diaporthe amygdali]KAJ0107366.1 DUF563 domain-containing protein [Diaporthe amygdali]